MVGKPVVPKCGLRVECVGNRHDNKQSFLSKAAILRVRGGSSYFVLLYNKTILRGASSSKTKSSKREEPKHFIADTLLLYIF